MNEGIAFSKQKEKLKEIVKSKKTSQLFSCFHLSHIPYIHILYKCVELWIEKTEILSCCSLTQDKFLEPTTVNSIFSFLLNATFFKDTSFCFISTGLRDWKNRKDFFFLINSKRKLIFLWKPSLHHTPDILLNLRFLRDTIGSKSLCSMMQWLPWIYFFNFSERCAFKDIICQGLQQSQLCISEIWKGFLMSFFSH